MSNSNTGNAEPKSATKQFSIVTRIAALLGLDDAGKIQKYFTREVKKLERGITSIEANQKSAKLTYDIAAIELTENIEDAQQAVEDAYEAVDVDSIKSNADCDHFASGYWNAIEAAEDVLFNAEKELERLTETFNDGSDARTEEVKIRKARIAKLA